MNSLISIFLFLLGCFCSIVTFAKSEGPFTLKGNCGNVFLSKGKQDSLIFFHEKNNISNVVDSFPPNRSAAEVKTVFLKKIAGSNNVILLIRWPINHRAINRFGYEYKVYAYTVKDCIMQPNQKVNSNSTLSGYDGIYNGHKYDFHYINAEKIKKYIDAHY